MTAQKLDVRSLQDSGDQQRHADKSSGDRGKVPASGHLVVDVFDALGNVRFHPAPDSQGGNAGFRGGVIAGSHRSEFIGGIGQMLDAAFVQTQTVEGSRCGSGPRAVSLLADMKGKAKTRVDFVDGGEWDAVAANDVSHRRGILVNEDCGVPAQGPTQDDYYGVSAQHHEPLVWRSGKGDDKTNHGQSRNGRTEYAAAAGVQNDGLWGHKPIFTQPAMNGETE